MWMTVAGIMQTARTRFAVPRFNSGTGLSQSQMAAKA
jgi:hypothetical protein